MIFLGWFVTSVAVMVLYNFVKFVVKDERWWHAPTELFDSKEHEMDT